MREIFPMWLSSKWMFHFHIVNILHNYLSFRYYRRSTKAESAFCGDGRCDATVESSSNCPIDCCQGVNPKCVAVNNTCPEACCGESHCCDGPLSDSLRFAQMFWKIVLGILASLLVLINVICCCCCYCCYSKCCKKTRRYSQIDLEMPHSHHRRWVRWSSRDRIHLKMCGIKP